MSSSNASSIVAALAPGGTSIDATYVPGCSSSVSFSDYVLTAAANYDVRHWAYYKGKWHDALAGWICAGICAVIALMLLIWLCCFCVCACCCGLSRQRGKGGPSSTANDFKTPAGPVPYGNARDRSPICRAVQYLRSNLRQGGHRRCEWRRSRSRRRHRCCGVLPLLCIAMLVITVALATWALVEGLRGVHHKVDDFWAIEQSIRDQISSLRQDVLAFFGGIASIQQAVSALSTALTGVDLNNIGLGDVNVSSNVASELASAASTLDSVVNGGDSVAASLNKYGIVGLDNARTKYQPESLKVQNTYLPVVLGVEYALLVVLAIVATVLLVLERPRTGGFFLLLFWICLIPVMFTGPGLYHSGQSVSDDTCLYIENFAFRVANSSHLDATTKTQVTQGFEYYLGLDGNTTAEEIAGEIYGVNLTGVDLLGAIPNVNSTIDFFGSTAGLRFIAAVANLSGTEGLNATGQALVADAPTQLNQTYAAFDTILSSVNRSAWTPLYAQLKDLVCCSLSNDVRSIWISWTAASAAAGVLGLLLILRLFCLARDYGRGRRPSNDQFITQHPQAGPYYQPPTVPVQADTGTPLAAPLNTAPPSWDGGQALPPQRRSLADRMRGPFGGRAGRAGTSSTQGPMNV